MMAVGFLFLGSIIRFRVVYWSNYQFGFCFLEGSNLILLRQYFHLKICNSLLKFQIFFFKFKQIMSVFWIGYLEFRREVRWAFHYWLLRVYELKPTPFGRPCQIPLSGCYPHSSYHAKISGPPNFALKILNRTRRCISLFLGKNAPTWCPWNRAFPSKWTGYLRLSREA